MESSAVQTVAVDTVSRAPAAAGRFAPEVAAGIAGLLVGLAYLVAQMVFSGLLDLGGAEGSLRRVAAILLGPGEAPPADGVSLPVAAMALLIHLPLAFVYGRLIGLVTRRLALLQGALAGAAAGLLLFALNFFVIAPSAFPWFVDVRNMATALDHVLFGALCAALANLMSHGR
ncbi:MAG: hypothetical protein ACOZJZ_02895 [Pseudomonadota bacterium]